MIPPKKRYRCRLCGRELPAWLPIFRRMDAAMLLHHLGQDHGEEVTPYLDRMDSEADIDRILLEVFDPVDAPA